MEEKNTFSDAETDQQESETAPVDIESLPLLHLYRPQGGLLFLQDEAVQQLKDEEANENAPFDQDRVHARNGNTRPLTDPQVAHEPPAAKTGMLPIALVLLVNIAIILSAIIATLLQTVTIVIVPKTQQITEHITLFSLQSRVFSPLTVTQRKTVVTTGHGYQSALQAHGSLTFYNASPQEQTIDAGTLLIGADGVQVVTDQTAYIPGSQPPIETQVSVSAHAVNTGTAGNMKAGDITGACCKAGVYVANSAFSGGQDARAYQTVTQADINTVVSSLLPTLTQAITTSFAKQVRPSETFTQPVCSQTITAYPQVKQEAASVTVSIKKSCVAAAYTTSSLQTKIMQALSEREPGYRLKAYFQLEPLYTALHGNRLSVSATYQATFRYQFTQAETDKVVSEIQGKQTRQVARLLEQLPGVEHITITTLADQDTLPTDKTYIHLLIVEG